MESMNTATTLITIVFGLMLTDLFAGVHRLIRARARVRSHWLTPLAAWYVFAIVLKNWWDIVFEGGGGLFDNGWSFFYYGHLSLLLYLIASAVLPDEVPAEGLDLRDFYFETRRQFWGLLAGVHGLLAAFALLGPAVSDRPLVWPAVVTNLVMIGICVSLAISRRPGYHATVVVVLVSMVVLEIATKF